MHAENNREKILEKLDEIDELDLAWAAGFIDGDGSITFSCNPQTGLCRVQLSVTQKDRQALLILQELFGGNIYHHGKDNKYWQWYPTDIELTIRTIVPYLKIKQERAERVIAGYYDTTKVAGHGYINHKEFNGDLRSLRRLPKEVLDARLELQRWWREQTLATKGKPSSQGG
jgi:hypothetical protein